MLSPTRRLSLTRRIHEEILVIDRQTGEQIVIAPTAYRGNQVKIGIQASDRFQILRRELQGRERGQTRS